MSGHSHFATIKRDKEAKDAKRGKVFSKMAREIAIAVKAGGGEDPGFNYKLRMVLDKARSYNMPKSNIERAIKAASTGGLLEEIMYEGFGPSGVAVLVKTATDNKNRTSQEIKNIFERAGGSMAGPGAVSFNFENRGYLSIKKNEDYESEMLALIDLGIEDIEEEDATLEVYVLPEKLSEMKEKIESAGFTVLESDLVMKPKSYLTLSDQEVAKKAVNLLETLDDHDDVQAVYSNLDIAE